MDDTFFDLQSVRNFFSKTQRISFGMLEPTAMKKPFINLFFKQAENKKIEKNIRQLSDALKGERLKLYINENGGDFLSLSFLWESEGVIFTAYPDHYNKRECREFRRNVFYGDIIKIFFLAEDTDTDKSEKPDREERSNLDVAYYEYKLE
jgi:hypothetical protein